MYHIYLSGTIYKLHNISGTILVVLRIDISGTIYYNIDTKTSKGEFEMKDTKFYWNDDVTQWERVDRIQEYRGIKIETLTVHPDSFDSRDRHREYRLTTPDGKVSYHSINKRRGGNIKDLKMWIDFRLKYYGAL